MGHSGPLSCFSNLSLFSRKFTVSHRSFTFPYPAYSFYSSFLASHFLPIYSLSLFHRYSQFTVFSQIFTVLYWHPASTLSISHSAPCLQDPHHLSQILHLFSPSVFLTVSYLVSGQSVIPAHSPDLQVFPLPPLSPQFFTDLPKILFPPSLTTWYLDSRSFRPTLQFSKSLLFLPNPYRSTQIFHSSSKILLPPSLTPFFITSPILVTLVSGQSVIPAHSPASKSLVFLLILIDLQRSSTDPSNILLPPSLTPWYLDSRSFRPTLQISKSLLFLLILTDPHRSSQIFHRSFKILLIPFTPHPFLSTVYSLSQISTDSWQG